MKLFISWSGDLSHRAALQLREWLPLVLPFLKPWVSSEDIPKGSRWALKLASELEDTVAGIICIVPANLGKPWLNFEAGALSKTVAQTQVHPFLLGLTPSELRGPLSQFQATSFDKEEVRKLVTTLNAAAGGAKLDLERLNSNFETSWPDLERQLTPIVADEAADGNETEAEPGVESSSSVELSEEYLSVLRVIVEAQDDRVFPSQLAGRLGIHQERAKYYMEKLERMGILHAAHNYVYGTSWYLSREGRSALVRMGLL